MKLHHKEIPTQKPRAIELGSFRTSFSVMADSIKDIYGIKKGCNQSLSEKTASEAQQPNQKTLLGEVVKYSYWFGLARIGAALSGVVGLGLAYTLAVYHPFFVSMGLKYASTRSKHTDSEEPSLGLKEKIRTMVSDIKQLVRPDRTTQVLTFSILEVFSFPLFLGVIEKTASLCGPTVTSATAIFSVAVGTAVATLVEYIGFRWLWKRFVLNGIKPGGLMGDLKGFIKEFSPLKLFYHKTAGPASTASEYIGQLWGTTQSYWVWIQTGRLAVAASIVSVAPLGAHDFIKALMTTLISGYAIFIDLLIPRYVAGVTKKFEENNRQLGLE